MKLVQVRECTRYTWKPLEQTCTLWSVWGVAPWCCFQPKRQSVTDSEFLDWSFLHRNLCNLQKSLKWSAFLDKSSFKSIRSRPWSEIWSPQWPQHLTPWWCQRRPTCQHLRGASLLSRARVEPMFKQQRRERRIKGRNTRDNQPPRDFGVFTCLYDQDAMHGSLAIVLRQERLQRLRLRQVQSSEVNEIWYHHVCCFTAWKHVQLSSNGKLVNPTLIHPQNPQ